MVFSLLNQKYKNNSFKNNDLISFLDPTEIYYLGSLSSPMLIPQSLAVHNVRIYWLSSSLCTFQLFNSPIPGTQSTEVQLNRDEQWDKGRGKKKKKKKNSFCVGQVVPASRKCFSVPPSHSGAWPRAKDGVWVSSPQKEKSAGTEVSGPHHTGTRRKPLPKL